MPLTKKTILTVCVNKALERCPDCLCMHYGLQTAIRYKKIKRKFKGSRLATKLSMKPFLRLCSDRAKANAKEKVFFDVWRLFFDIFLLVL